MTIDFEAPTPRGKVQRLRRLAIHALEQYDVDVGSIHLLGTFTNTMFRVQTIQGESYVLRLCAPGWRTEYVAHYERQYLNQHITQLAQQLEKFLETGLIRKRKG